MQQKVLSKMLLKHKYSGLINSSKSYIFLGQKVFSILFQFYRCMVILKSAYTILFDCDQNKILQKRGKEDNSKNG